MAKKVNKSDFEHLAEYVHGEWKRRKNDRKDLDYQIKEIDRQIEMKPDKRIKQDDKGAENVRLTWLPEIELPLQAEALETLTSDARSMQFPDTGPWFAAKVALTDEYLQKVDYQSLIAGDQNDIPSKITQDNADKLVAGLINHWHRQYDFRGNIDVINAEAMSYGCGVGRARKIKKSVYRPTSRGVVKDTTKIPVLIPKTLKYTYLDDRTASIMQEGYDVGPMTIFERSILLEDLKEKARGSRDPESEDGGWMPSAVNKMEPDKQGCVELVEAEGDFVIPRKTTGSIFTPNTVVTIAVDKNGPKVIRIRYNQSRYNSVLVFPYHKERVGSPYAASPLMKGRPIQAAATMAMIWLQASAALNTLPPVGYDRSDTWFESQGGPNVEPGAIWGSISDVNPHNDISNPVAMLQIYQALLMQYADAVGMHRARLGAQTLSHTTAYAKNAELQRGAVRTVDYARSTLQGPLTQWLYMSYEMGLKGFRETTYHIDSYKGFVTVEKKHLPELVAFEAFGSSGPAEEREKRAEKINALVMAMQMDQAHSQLTQQPLKLNVENAIEQILLEGGWADIDPFLQGQDMGQGNAPDMRAQALLQRAAMEQLQ